MSNGISLAKYFDEELRQPRFGFVVKCANPACGATGHAPRATMKGRSDDEVERRLAEEKLKRAGWKIGGSASQHRCPKCFRAIRAIQSRKNEEKMVNVVEMKAPPPKQMGRDDRRVIFEKLNDVYLNEKDGYGPGWTDVKVAADLGTPRDWVRQVREEMFGPEGSNEEIRKLITEAGLVLADARSLAMAGEEWIKKLKDVADRCGRIEREIDGIKKAVK